MILSVGVGVGESEGDATPPLLSFTDNQLTPTTPIRRLLTTIIRKCCLSISPTDSTSFPFEPITPNTLNHTANNFTTTDITTTIYIGTLMRPPLIQVHQQVY